ncbi:MAG: tyrosine--tRNA ligase [Thermoplasmata archaeon]|nr:tyrosine--tRNA ligase [Thermoplasmata archaeon]
MDLEERINLVMRNAAEVVTQDELREILATVGKPKAYIGFEPSGFMHIGHIVCAEKIKDLQKAGFEVTVLLADWHAHINDKLGGNLENIKIAGAYMRDSFLALGVEPEKTRFVFAEELVDSKDYWKKVILVAKNSTLSRIKRTLTIMGRQEDESESDTSKLIYPCMQVADIFELDVDVAYGGMDQRKAHMLARELREKLGRKKFVAVHTPLLSGLQSTGRMDIADAKMSKSNPDSCIFLHDTPEEIKRKMKKAYCPQKVVEGNPVLEIARYIIFPKFGKLEIVRDEKFGGNLTLNTPEELERIFAEDRLHPADLKTAVAGALVEILESVREYYAKHSENLERLKEIKVSKLR